MDSVVTFFQIEVIASTVLIIVLIVLGVVKKEQLISDTAISRLKKKWFSFKLAFYLGVLTMIIFLLLISTEMIETSRGVPLRTLYPVETEWIKIVLVFVLFVVNLVNLNLLLNLVGDDK